MLEAAPVGHVSIRGHLNGTLVNGRWCDGLLIGDHALLTEVMRVVARGDTAVERNLTVRAGIDSAPAAAIAMIRSVDSVVSAAIDFPADGLSMSYLHMAEPDTVRRDGYSICLDGNASTAQSNGECRRSLQITRGASDRVIDLRVGVAHIQHAAPEIFDDIQAGWLRDRSPRWLFLQRHIKAHLEDAYDDLVEVPEVLEAVRAPSLAGWLPD